MGISPQSHLIGWHLMTIVSPPLAVDAVLLKSTPDGWRQKRQDRSGTNGYRPARPPSIIDVRAQHSKPPKAAQIAATSHFSG
jgi:hypothetical protein